MKKDIVVVGWLTCPCGSNDITVNTEGDKIIYSTGIKSLAIPADVLVL